jgi:hypothetical protein
MKINYNRVIDYGVLGRNGMSKTSGISIESIGSEVQLTLLSSKGELLMAYMDIPKEHIHEIIDELKKYV